MKIKPLVLPLFAVATISGGAAYLAFHSNGPDSTTSRAVANNTHDARRASDTTGQFPGPIEAVQAPLMDSNGAPVFLNRLLVKDYVASRYEQAKKGDAQAAFEIYRAETLCAHIPDQQNAVALLEPGGKNNAAVDALKSTINSEKAVCVGFADEQSAKERIEYLTQAAKGKMPDAEVAFFMEGPNGQLHDFSQPDDNPDIASWKKTAVGFLTDAAEQGNSLAMSMLSKAYQDGEVVSRDLQQSLTYAVANALVRNLDPGSQTTVNALSKQLTSDQVRQAITAGTDIANRCCGKHR